MPFDPQAAAAAYIDALGPAKLAQAAAYTTGAHWLLLWDLVVTALVTLLLVRTGALERVSARLASRGTVAKNFLVSLAYVVLASLITLPWVIYEQWWRETSYGRTSQPLGDFLGQSLLGLCISALLASIFLAGMYAFMRRTGRRWWLWSAALAAAGITVLMIAAPIFIEPLFNKFEPVPAGEVRDALVQMAQRAGVPPDRIFVYDGSRQSNNFTANVAGIGHTARVAISDVALKGASLDEVKAVTGHEIGHYVLGHVWLGVAMMSGLALIFFFLADRLFPVFARGFGSRATIAEPTGLPVLAFMASLFMLLAQPLANYTIRKDESEADHYSFETVNLPDAMATALVKTAEYRNPRPGELEEILFYTHPSVERRVLAAMEWKAAHPPSP